MFSKLPLYGKLTAMLVIFTLFTSAAVLTLTMWSNSQYHAEVTQLLNRQLANYIIDHQEPLFDEQGNVHTYSLESTAMHTMMINPLVEVYLLNPQGQILGHALNSDDVILKDVNLHPVFSALRGEENGPIYGDDPRTPGEKSIFSTAPVIIDGELKGYLYVVLSSQNFDSIAEQLTTSYVLKVSLGAMAALILVMFISLYVGFKRITKPLKKLTDQTRTFFAEEKQALTTGTTILPRDELSALEASFDVMQDRIKDQFREMQQSEHLRRELISNISHDLRTPLASIQGYIETVILKLDRLDNVQKKDYLKIALRHSERLGKLIAALFELSKLESRSMAVDKTPFSIAELIHDIVQEFGLHASKKGITFNLNQEVASLMVMGDLSLIARVFQNLIDNALRHTPNGGEINIDLSEHANSVVVSIQDSGIGIAKDELPYIFDRYYKSSNSASKPQAGTGLGLAIVKRILELHNSTINVISEPNKGACFTFPLPLVSNY
jgi:signal transduction histidine kinase